VAGGCKSRNRILGKLGAEGHDQRVTGQRLSTGHDCPRCRINAGDFFADNIDALALETRERPTNLVRSACADGKPQQRRLEHVVLFALDEYNVVATGEQLAKPVGRDDTPDAAAKDERSFGGCHRMPDGFGPRI
jgi:hypothetical protein